MDNEAKPKPRKGTVGGGRAIGQKNLVAPAVKRSVAEIFRGMMGLDDEAVERTGRIDGKGYGFRLRWKEILDGKRTPDPAYTNAVKLSLAYAVGNPGKFQDAVKPRESLVFLTTNGMVPWDPRADSMREITDRTLAEKKADERLALEAKAEPVAADKDAGDTEIPETLELVDAPPSPEDFNRGRSR